VADLTHLDEKGRASMVDVSGKEPTLRDAVAAGEVRLDPETFDAVIQGQVKKGDVFSTARIAAIQAAKKTPDLIPLCHPIRISRVTIDFLPDEAKSTIGITATVSAQDRTGVEMEALTAVSVAALTIYDMVKSLKRETKIGNIRLVRKSGGRSGEFTASG
jgi:cyclic pyranopterin phosphate synthase